MKPHQPPGKHLSVDQLVQLPQKVPLRNRPVVKIPTVE